MIMHVSRMLKCFVETPMVVTPLVFPNRSETSDDIGVIRKMLEQMSWKLDIQASETTYMNSLNGDQAERVMDSVFQLKEKYFQKIPLTDVMKKDFVWNIPSKVYKYLLDVEDKELGDVMNPMLLFYIFLTEDPKLVYGKYLQILMTILCENKSIIDEYAEEYDAYSSENEGE